MNTLPEYKTLEDKQEFFAPATEYTPWIINTKEEFDNLYGFLVTEYIRDFESGCPTLFYRGVNQARYKTFTSAQRHWLWNDWENDTRAGFVEYIAEEIRKIRSWSDLKNYYKSLDVTPTDILYLAYLQHFEGASPLLDITHSLDVGLFFAFDKMTPAKEDEPEINKYVTLQIIDFKNYSRYYFNNIVRYLNEGIQLAKRMTDTLKANHPEQYVDISLIENIDKYTAWYNPQNPGGDIQSIDIALLDFDKEVVAKDLKGRPLYWSNIRLIAQRGAFLLYTGHEMPLEEFIRDKIKAPLITAINIRKDLCDYVMRNIPINENIIYPREVEIVKDANIRAINSLRKINHTKGQ